MKTKTELELEEKDKIIKALKKVLCFPETHITDEESKTLFEQEKLSKTDVKNIMLIRGTSEKTISIMALFIEDVYNIYKMPTMDYKHSNMDILPLKLSGLCLKKAVGILLACGDETIKIRVKPDYPMILYNKDFEIMIAPRVGGKE